jgi:pimeloyl-ACP methyl ester carboxylesterase
MVKRCHATMIRSLRTWRLYFAQILLVVIVVPSTTTAAEWEDLQVEVEGRSYHVRLIRNRNDGPSLVLESGIAARVGHWDEILPELARIAPVLAYERPGIGASPDDVEYEPTPEAVVRSLRALLRTAGMPSPYVLVGHSLGAIYAKAFVDRYPDESAGLVLIDPTDFNESWAGWCRIFDEMGVGQEGRRLFRAELDRLYGLESAAIVREWDVVKELRRASFAGLRSLDSLQNMPTRVLLGARISQAPTVMDLPAGFSFTDFQRVFMEHRHRNLWRWIEQLPDCRVVTTTRSGHFIHQEEPGLVVREIDELYAAWRK